MASRAYLLRHNVQLEVTVEEAKAFFEAHKDEATLPERRSFRNLLLKTDPATLAASGQTAAEVCRRAEELRGQAMGGASFEELVIAHSESANAAAGGLVGMISRAQIRREVGDLLFALEPGETSTVLQNQAGCQIFQLVQSIPAQEPRFELQYEAIVRRLAEEKRAGEYRRLLQSEAKASGAALPAWLGRRPPADLAADAVLFELGGERLLVREVAGPGGGVTAERVETAIGERLFAHAEERDRPEETRRLFEHERAELAADYLRQKALLAHVRALPEESLRAYFEERKTRYVSEPKLEVTLYSWPLPKGDPLAALGPPEAFVRELNTRPGADKAREIWQRYASAGGAAGGGKREEVSQRTLRELLLSHPELSTLLAGKLEEGRATGPARAGGRLYVMAVNLYVPERPLGFVEVRERLIGDYAVERGLAEWGEALAKERGFAVEAANLEAFGAALVERLRVQPTSHANPATP